MNALELEGKWDLYLLLISLYKYLYLILTLTITLLRFTFLGKKVDPVIGALDSFFSNQNFEIKEYSAPVTGSTPTIMTWR